MPGQRADGQRPVKLGHRPVQRGAQAAVFRQRPAGVLGLPAGPVHRHHHAPGHVRGGARPVVPVHQVQAQVDPGRQPRAGQHRPLVDVQHVRVEPDGREPGPEVVRLLPVRGRRQAVEQTRRRQRERTNTDGGDPGAAGGRGPQGVLGRERRVAQRVVARHDDGVRLLQRVQPGRGVDAEPGGGRNRAGALGAHRERVALALVPVPEHLRRDGQVEGHHLRQRERHHPVPAVPVT